MFLTPEQREVATPALTATLIAVMFLAVLLKSSPIVPLDEVGTWYVAAVAMYTVLPLLVFLVLGLQYTPLNDSRLFSYQPSPEQVGQIGWYCTIYLVSFVTVYLAARRRPLPPLPNIQTIPSSTIIVVVTLWLLTSTFSLVLGLFFNLSAETYWGSYLAIQQLPLPVRQAAKLLSGMRFIFSLTLLIWLFSDYSRKRWIIALWLVFEVAQTLTHAGERTSLMMLLAASVILYHRLVRPLRLWVALSGGTLALAAFMALGVYRTFRGLEDPGVFTFGVSAGEFESIFGNAFDLQQRRTANELNNVPVAVYLSDIVAVIPSQILPFEKVDAANWYLDTFYTTVKAEGGGFSFGVVAQSIIGIGWLELILRGAFLGYLFALLHRYYRRYSVRLWVTVGYLWMMLLAYQSFRNTTLSVLSMFIQQLIPSIVLVEVVRSFLGKAILSTRVPSPAI